jgi:hypothetical protein
MGHFARRSTNDGCDCRSAILDSGRAPRLPLHPCQPSLRNRTFAIQYQFADFGAWYPIGLGLTAVAFAMFLPGGLWSLVLDRFHIRLMPVDYKLAITNTCGLVTCARNSGSAHVGA